MKKIFPAFIMIAIYISSCTSGTKTNEIADSLALESSFIEYNNPPAVGFNQENSDLLATLLADKSMQAMGGRSAWDSTRYIGWTFFGKRNHLWDKWTGDIRIGIPQENLIILMNIHTKEGQVQKSGKILSDEPLDFYLDQGYKLWVNDAYWLVMPYKLKDSGVTLKYLREDTTQLGTLADVVSLSFDGVGVTPQNRYDVWIDVDSKLVSQWAYYPDSTHKEPSFINPWLEYKQHGQILLSGNRGEYKLTNIQVYTDVEVNTFRSF